MASAASLVVRISADLNDFSRGLDKATRDVDRAASKIIGVGKALTIGFTLPVTAAAVALSKMAAENEDTAGRMQRVFGSAADAIDGSLKQMMRSVPEAQTELQNMAISVDHMIQGMDVAPDKAATMSLALVKLAGDASAFAHVPMAQALDAIEHGLAGKTKGLLEFGIAISAADIKQQAFKMGILTAGNELTETGTALASYNLIMQRSASIQGESARTADQQGKQFAFLKRDLVELADNLSSIVLPTMSGLAKGAREVVDAISKMPPALAKLTFGVSGVIAVAIPAATAFVVLTSAVVKFKTAIDLATKVGGFVGLLAEIANPLGQILVIVAAVSAAFIGLYEVWQKFKPPSAKDLLAPLNNDPQLAALIGGPKFSGAGVVGTGKNGNTQFNPKDPAAQLTEGASAVSRAFDDAVNHGASLVGILSRVNQLHAEAVSLLSSQSDRFGKEAEAGRQVADQMQRLKDIGNVLNAAPGQDRAFLAGIANRPFNAGAAGATSAVDAAENYRRDLATRSAASYFGTPFNAGQEAVIKSRGMVESNANDLALRESLLQLPDGFNAARQAAVGLAEEQRSTAEQNALAFEKVRLGLDGFGLKLNNLGTGMQSVVVNLASTVTSMAQSLAARLAGGGQNAGFFGSVGGIIGGAFKIGSFFNPLLGAAGSIAGSLIGGLFDHAKRSTDAAASSLDTLSTTANKVNEALSNLPQGFKIARDRYLATVPGSGPNGPVDAGGGAGGNQGGTPLTGSSTITIGGDLHVNGVNVSNAGTLIRAITDAAKANMSRGGNSFLIAAQRA